VKKTAVVTGASAGIGEATARRLVAEGFDVVIGARRIERIEKLAAEIGARWASLDVTDQASVDAFCAPLTTVHVLVNNAGGAKGLAHVAEADEEHWRWMYETNVLGLMRVTRALLPALERSGDGHIVNLGSIAGIEAYPGGAGYTSVKHGVRAISQSLRQELLGRPIRVSEIAPGLVEQGLRRHAAADGRRHRRLHRVGGHPPEPRQHRLHAGDAACAGEGDAGAPQCPRRAGLTSLALGL